MTAEALLAEYTDRHDQILKPLAEALTRHLQDNLRGIERIDRIAARAKSPLRFVAKGMKAKDDGGVKYDHADGSGVFSVESAAVSPVVGVSAEGKNSEAVGSDFGGRYRSQRIGGGCRSSGVVASCAQVLVSQAQQKHRA